MSIHVFVAEKISATTPIAASGAAAKKAVRLPSFDEVMAELMLQLAIRNESRKEDARRPRRVRVAKEQARGK